MKTLTKGPGLLVLSVAIPPVRANAVPGSGWDAFEKLKSVEMTTLYYLDGDQVKLTHYCMAGNQPTMRGTYAPDTRTIVFDFVGATNLKSANDGHMHHATYTFIDDDHFKTTW